MKIRIADLLAIKEGESPTFVCSDGRQCESVRQRAYRINNLNPDRGIRLSVAINWGECKITVKAIKTDELKKAE